SSRAIFIIPGSFHNQSHGIYREDVDNYHHGILDLADEFDCDVYIFVKQNHDFLAVHDEKQKLTFTAIVAGAINAGRSYSARYLADAVAMAMHLKDSYDEVIFVGLSQGGFATLIVSSIVEPELSIIASGYSSLLFDVHYANMHQIIIPGLDDYFRPAAL